MPKNKISTAERVAQIVEPFAKKLGLTIWDIRFQKEGGNNYLRIFIDKEGGVSIDDCVNLTHEITKPLDDADPISQSYMLEVSSPGIERDLTRDAHFEMNIGSPVMLRLIRPRDGVRDFKGMLRAYDSGRVTVLLEDESELEFDKKEASYIKLDDFNLEDFDI